MQLVAIRPRPGDDAPERLSALCEASGLPRYEAGARIRVLGGWPGVLLSVAEIGRAVELDARLRKDRFETWTMPGLPAPRRVLARRFELRGDILHVEGDGAELVQVRRGTARLMLGATDFRVEIEQVLEHRGENTTAAAAARALLGLRNRSAVPQPTERRRDRRDPFVRLLAVGVPAVEFRASALQYAALPSLPVAPTRIENFSRAVQRLRDALPGVAWDDRLVARSAQTRVLGPGLSPQHHLEAAIALLSRDVVGTDDPYR